MPVASIYLPNPYYQHATPFYDPIFVEACCTTILHIILFFFPTITQHPSQASNAILLFRKNYILSTSCAQSKIPSVGHTITAQDTRLRFVDHFNFWQTQYHLSHSSHKNPLKMLRSTRTILKQATRLAPPPIAKAATHTSSASVAPYIISRSSSNATSSSASDYEQIMNHRNSLRSGTSYFSSAASPPPSSWGESEVGQHSMASPLYRSVAEPTKYEDYDNYEMHHPPSEKTQVSYYEASFDPSAAS